MSTGKLRPSVSAAVPAYGGQQGLNRVGGKWWNNEKYSRQRHQTSDEVLKSICDMKSIPNDYLVSFDLKTSQGLEGVKTRHSKDAVYKCASKLVNATSTCSDVNGDFVRPFQVMRRRLFQNLQRTTRSAQPKQLATFLACCVKKEFSMYTSLISVAGSHLAQSTRNVAEKGKHLQFEDSPSSSICSIKSAKALGLLWITFFETESHIQWPPLGSASAGIMSTSIWTSLERDATKPNRPRLTETGTPGGKVHPVNCTSVLCQSSSKIVGETSASLKRSTKSISLAQSLPQSSLLLMSDKHWNVRLGRRLGVWNDFGRKGTRSVEWTTTSETLWLELLSLH